MGLPVSIHERMPDRLPLSLGFSRYALKFDGGRCVEVAHDESLNIANMTVLAWIKPLVQPDVYRGQIIGKGDGWNLQLYTEEPYVRLALRRWVPDYIEVMSDEFPLGWDALDRCHQVGFTSLDGVVEFFVNARAAGTAAFTPTLTAYPVQIGYMRMYGRHPFNGAIDEVLLYDRSLSKAEIRYDMLNYHSPIRDGLVMWLRLDEGAGLKAYDGSGYGNDGDLLPTADPPRWVRNKMWELRSEVGL